MHLCGELQSSSLQICIRIPCYPSPIFFVEQYTFGLNRQILKRLCPKMIYVILVHLSGELQSFARQICIKIPCYPYPMFFVQQYTFGINRQILKRLCPKIIYVILMHLCGELQSSALQICIRIPCYPSLCSSLNSTHSA